MAGKSMLVTANPEPETVETLLAKIQKYIPSARAENVDGELVISTGLSYYSLGEYLPDPDFSS